MIGRWGLHKWVERGFGRAWRFLRKFCRLVGFQLAFWDGYMHAVDGCWETVAGWWGSNLLSQSYMCTIRLGLGAGGVPRWASKLIYARLFFDQGFHSCLASWYMHTLQDLILLLFRSCAYIRIRKQVGTTCFLQRAYIETVRLVGTPSFFYTVHILKGQEVLAPLFKSKSSYETFPSHSC